MDKKLIKSGDPIPPEFFNALQDLSFTKGPGEVGGLPNPPGKMEFFEATGGGSVDVSSANGVGAVILNVGSQISTDKETLTITGCNPAMGRCPGVIFVIPRGAAYELDVVLPCTAASTETITLHAGCAGIFTFQYYQGNTSWKCCEIKPPEYDVRMKFFEATGGGSVDVSSACDGAAMILNVGSQISTDKETLTITGCNPAMGRCPGFITVVPRGAAYELDVVLPCTAASTETITLHAGCAGIFTFQYYQGNTNWRCHEINRRDLPAWFKEAHIDDGLYGKNASFDEEVSAEEVIGESLTAHNPNQRAFFDVNVDDNGILTLLIMGNENYCAQEVLFNSNTGLFRVGHAGGNDIAPDYPAGWVSLKDGTILVEKRHHITHSSVLEKTGVNIDFDVEGNPIYNDLSGLCIYHYVGGNMPEARKVIISPYGLKFFVNNQNFDGWTQLNGIAPSA